MPKNTKRAEARAALRRLRRDCQILIAMTRDILGDAITEAAGAGDNAQDHAEIMIDCATDEARRIEIRIAELTGAEVADVFESDRGTILPDWDFLEPVQPLGE